jgi:NAD(P)H-hydrate epimerase
MISVQGMRKLEDSCGISKLQLMENAGRGVFKVLKDKYPSLKDKRILVACYHGNNGGDGFVASRHLSQEAETDVLFIGDEGRFSKETAANFKRIENDDRIQLFIEPEQTNFDNYDIIIDALLGTGFVGDVKENLARIIEEMNSSSAFKVSVDVPSGINADTGQASDIRVDAGLIVTFHDIKQGMEKYKEKTAIVDIGINSQ